MGRLLTPFRVWVSPATRCLACTRCGEAPMVIGDPSGGSRGFRVFLISCVMSANSSPLTLRGASLIWERVRDLLEDLPDPLLRPPQD